VPAVLVEEPNSDDLLYEAAGGPSHDGDNDSGVEDDCPSVKVEAVEDASVGEASAFGAGEVHTGTSGSAEPGDAVVADGAQRVRRGRPTTANRPTVSLRKRRRVDANGRSEPAER
jgi:hypothetical protein